MNLATCSAESASIRFPWYALQCWLRKETMIAAQLEGQGFECFLPKYKSVREWSDRKKEVEQPLFPGYLFCRFDYTQRRPVVVTPGVLQVVGCGRTPTPIEDREMEAIQIAQGFLLPSIMLSGYIFPIASLPVPLQWLSRMLPATHFINISRAIIIRGASFLDFWPNVAALLLISAILIALSARAFKKTVS